METKRNFERKIFERVTSAWGVLDRSLEFRSTILQLGQERLDAGWNGSEIGLM